MVLAQPASPLNALTAGLQLGQYQLLEKIGVGGQGVVWSAVDRIRNDTVAIKFNTVPDSDKNRADEMIFEQQLGRLLELRHAHVLPIYDSGLQDQTRYLVSPYVAGGSLFELIRAGALTPVDALRFAAEIAAALDYLHGQGVIHRDIKSSNILMDLSRHSYLADFGLARALSDTTQPMHTGRGTALYAPPEQHKLAEITPKSDIFSFGILLYELFTGQLPWNGEKALGMRQLHSDDQLPDPLELNARLPPRIGDVLSRVTAADPALRPGTAGEVMQALYFIFNIQAFAVSNDSSHDIAVMRSRDTGNLLKQSLARWRLDERTTSLSLTQFVLVDQEQKKESEAATVDLRRFMLLNALSLGYDHEYWWPRVPDSRDRLLISSALLERHDEAIAARVLPHLIADQDIRAVRDRASATIVTSLMEMAARTDNPLLREQLTAGLRMLLPPPGNWTDAALDPAQNKLLAELALEDSDFGDEAARLIGRLRSRPAVRIVLNDADKSRRTAALLVIRQSAGSLPGFVPGGLRLQVFAEWLVRRLIARPVQIISAYLLALLGAASGIGIQVYLTYRLPDFLDIPRIASSIEQGLIVGTIFGLGIIGTRVIVERFSGSSAWLRVLLGSIVGTIGMNIALFIFHVLFLNTPPVGFLITLGCMLIALSFALGGLIRQPLIKITLSIIGVFFAIAGTWWVHINQLDLTPIFRYDYTWSTTQVLSTALAVAALMGIFGNMVDLAIKDQ